MPLPVPIEAAVNKEEVAAYEAKKAEAEAKGERLSGEEKVSCVVASQFVYSNPFYCIFLTIGQTKNTCRGNS